MDQKALQHHVLKVFSELESRIAQRIIDALSQQPNAVTGTLVASENLLKDGQLCEALQISTSHFYKMKKAHRDFPVYNVHGAKRYKLSEVEQFIKSLNQ
ncbi:helix-turn-helix domain-containing protein [Gelidibacter pelagius]|uniref:Helix-turn-helix domain-containing protein n=1 Tax=Gelidibacter pelagius TaxID=2819985 RepID=A0ABS3SM72_9FLAO|nr:helix-turn-helix domain-containing protein [Gelidibacter pelagius]MBO3096808.1 helix-turn-helix domain-containing protein [Gelidibacter pelagius]